MEWKKEKRGRGERKADFQFHFIRAGKRGMTRRAFFSSPFPGAMKKKKGKGKRDPLVFTHSFKVSGEEKRTKEKIIITYRLLDAR